MHAARPGRRGAGGAGAGARGLLCTAEPCCCYGLKTSLLVVSALGPRWGGAPREPPNYRAWHLRTLDLPWPFCPPSPQGPLLRCEPRLPTLTDGFP